jgi:hypothetical protein
MHDCHQGRQKTKNCGQVSFFLIRFDCFVKMKKTNERRSFGNFLLADTFRSQNKRKGL